MASMRWRIPSNRRGVLAHRDPGRLRQHHAVADADEVVHGESVHPCAGASEGVPVEGLHLLVLEVGQVSVTMYE